MLNKLRFAIENAEDLNSNMGPLYHGFLMEQINPDYGNYLHESQLKPFSQYFYYDKREEKWIWEINTLNEEAYRQLIVPVMNIKIINLNHNNQTLKVIEVHQSKTVDFQTLTKKYYLEQGSKSYFNTFIQTPCSFKVQGEHLIFPSVFHIYQSLMLKFNAFSNTIKLEDENVLKHLTEHTKICNYHLKSNKFTIGKGLVTGFSGNIHFGIDGNETLKSLGNLLFAFGNYSGIGVKTSLGMGGILTQL